MRKHADMTVTTPDPTRASVSRSFVGVRHNSDGVCVDQSFLER
jgi:hypothetical protein